VNYENIKKIIINKNDVWINIFFNMEGDELTPAEQEIINKLATKVREKRGRKKKDMSIDEQIIERESRMKEHLEKYSKLYENQEVTKRISDLESVIKNELIAKLTQPPPPTLQPSPPTPQPSPPTPSASQQPKQPKQELKPIVKKRGPIF
jgi:hypothetical protein